ncbi:MAG TPA: BlaI/MecI/CopY family transcriptional regulator [Pyrinomonadaceae bacterium]
MARRAAARPTDSELEILRVLWQKGACTVREVHHEINKSKPTGYTTVLKLMQIMTEKGLVERDEGQRAHVYVARLAQGETQRQLLGDLLERAFDGSAAKLMMHVLSDKKASAKELSEIRELLDRFERGQR